MSTSGESISQLRNYVKDLLPRLSTETLEELESLLSLQEWMPLAGPQMEAIKSKADIVFFGGAAGGSKSEGGIGLALMYHQRSIIFRREAVQLIGLEDRIAEILGSRDGYNGQTKIWRVEVAGIKRQIELGSCQYPDDWQKYMGRPHDLAVFDELAHFLEHQFRALCGWLRTTDPDQRCRVFCAGNPPTSAEGLWIIEFFAPWLDPNHPNPAEPGELRWYAQIDGVETEVESGEPFEHNGMLEHPKSRTFIPSKVQDNPYYMETGYLQQLQALPEVLRKQMLDGDFMAGTDDNRWQLIPTAWVEAAMKRWQPRDPKGPMDSMGVDVARGGKDSNVVSCRHGVWFDELDRIPGKATPDGQAVVAQVIMKRRDDAPVHIDVIGVGSSPYDLMKGMFQTVDCNNARSTKEKTLEDTMGFKNERAMDYWRMREALDPANGRGICLPNDTKLKADLCSVRWKPVGSGPILVQCESKEDIAKRIGRSTDDGDAVVMALRDTDKINDDEDFSIEFASEWRS